MMHAGFSNRWPTRADLSGPPRRCFALAWVVLTVAFCACFAGIGVNGSSTLGEFPAQPPGTASESGSGEPASTPSASLPDPGYRQTIQQQVREMARRLVNEQITLQMTQLEENGLTELPLYGELKEMQQHLDELVDQHMKEVLRILAQMMESPAESRLKLLEAAREKSRLVLAQLMLERQRVLRRLRLAEIEELARQLIAREQKVRERTELLPAQPSTQQAVQALSVREDQRDVNTLYTQVKQFLNDIVAWGGPVGRTADLALRALQEDQVDRLFVESLQALTEARFSEAVAKEDQIIAALEKLLTRIETLHGDFNRDNPDAVQKALEELARRQEQLRQQTLQADAPETFEELTREQLELRNAITEAAKKLTPQAPPALSDAAEAASRAAEELFQNQGESAAQEQQNVLESLARAQSELQQRAASPDSGADLLDAMAARQKEADLLAAREALRQLREEQSRASDQAANHQLQSAAQAEQKIASGVAEVPKDKQLPKEVTSAIHQAAETVERVGEKLANLAARSTQSPAQQNASPEQAGTGSSSQNSSKQPSQSEEPTSPEAPSSAQAAQSTPSPSESPARQLTRQAEQALDEALSAVEMALADAQRRRLAAEVVENVRAAWHQPAGNSPDWEAAQRAAQQLQEVTAQQLAQARQARQAVEQYLPSLSGTEQLGHQLENVQRAQQQVIEAAARQQEAAGHPEVAAALREAPSAEKALEVLREAARLTASHASPPSERTEKQQQVTAAIAEAQKALGDVNVATPEEANREAAQAAQALQKAKDLSRQAEQPGESNTTENQAPSDAFPRAVTQELASAAEHLQSLAQQLASQSRSPFAAHTESAERLASEAIPVHPEATAQLHAAENASRGVLESTSPQTVPPAQEATGQGFAGALSALAEREHQLAAALLAAQQLPQMINSAPQQIMNESPDPTSQQTGPADAIAAALAALQNLAAQAASGREQPQGVQPATSQTAQTASNSSPQGQGGAARQGEQVQNQNPAQTPLKEGKVPQTDSRTGVAAQLPVTTEGSANSAQTWLLQLPPEIREALRAGMNAPIPKGYEDRLRRYFQNAE
ncbi:hypothetical protein [Thermogutta sp.]|uniref:hypothetical protein n=1 Tax=Thermogutta sp. TaxID=1962930 RepID=UPI003C7D14FE